MREPWRVDFAWAQRWVPALRRFIGPHLLRVGTLEEDRREATDLIVLHARGLRIACRVRRPNYARNGWQREVTITTRRDSGAPCEWDKMIVGGMADWFCYAHATADTPVAGELRPAFLIDLALARPWLLQLAKRTQESHNRDPHGARCWFRAFKIEALCAMAGKEVLIASHGAMLPSPPGGGGSGGGVR